MQRQKDDIVFTDTQAEGEKQLPKARRHSKKVTRPEIESLTLRFHDSEGEHLHHLFPDSHPREVFFNGEPIGRRVFDFENFALVIGTPLSNVQIGDTITLQNFPVSRQHVDSAIHITHTPRALEVEEKFSQTYFQVREVLKDNPEIESASREIRSLLYLLNENKHLLEENSRLHRELGKAREENLRLVNFLEKFDRQPLIRGRDEIGKWLERNLGALSGDLEGKCADYRVVEEESNFNETIDYVAVSGDNSLVAIFLFCAETLADESSLFTLMLRIKGCERALGREVEMGRWGVTGVRSLLLTSCAERNLIDKCLINNIQVALFRNGYSIELIG